MQLKNLSQNTRIDFQDVLERALGRLTDIGDEETAELAQPQAGWEKVAEVPVKYRRVRVWIEHIRELHNQLVVFYQTASAEHEAMHGRDGDVSRHCPPGVQAHTVRHENMAECKFILAILKALLHQGATYFNSIITAHLTAEQRAIGGEGSQWQVCCDWWIYASSRPMLVTPDESEVRLFGQTLAGDGFGGWPGLAGLLDSAGTPAFPVMALRIASALVHPHP